MDCFEELENKKGEEYVELANLIVKKSKFNIDKLGEYVAHFLTLFYGEKFIFVIGSNKVNEKVITYKYVARRKDKVENLTRDNVNKLYNRDEIAILDIIKNGRGNNFISIYSFEDDTLYDNGKLTPIVKEFIDNIINIKVNGGICNDKSVLDVEYKLLNKYYNQIKENYDLAYENKKDKVLNELNSQFQEKYLELNRLLAKK